MARAVFGLDSAAVSIDKLVKKLEDRAKAEPNTALAKHYQGCARSTEIVWRTRNLACRRDRK